MKTMKQYLSMAALALVGAMMTGCSNDDDAIVNNPQQPENKNNVVTLTTTVGFDDAASTRALTATGVKTFAAGDQIAVIYTKNGGTVTKAVSEALPAGSYGANATFTVTLDNPDKTQNVTYIYPAAMAGSTGVDYTKLNSQSSGTLTDLGSKYDLATNSGAWNAGALPSLTLNNQLAILAITLKNSTDITSNITGMTISDGTNTYNVSRSAVAGPIYVAIQPTSGATIEVTATDGTDDYVKTLTSKTYAANNGYNVTWNMTKLPKVTWNSTNVFNDSHQTNQLDKWNTTPLTYEEITISFNGSGTASSFKPYNLGPGPYDEVRSKLECFGASGDSFTFTAPSGKKFTKVEIIDNYFINFTAYGDWTKPANNKIVWSGTAANAVTLGGSNNTIAQDLNSIVFTLKDE